ncbi:MAG: glutamate--tRNA ligase [Acidimicrobiales bacterium]
MTSPSRCRYAPSPTGFLHVGSAQSALFNWLWAQHSGAELLLRIEDTDAERNRPELTDNIFEMLQWLGIGWEGEPVHQSDHTADHVALAHELAADGHAYWCDCTPEQVQERNKATGGKPGYDGCCRDRGLTSGVLRFRTPDDGVTAWDDLVRGKVTFDNANLEDFVILRSNGQPMFLLANVADDVAMGITHVIRGEDHVNGTPKYLLLRAALGVTDDIPTFAHLPLLVNEQRKKLSKRRDDVSVADYKAAGYLPEAMRNHLALLGWGPPDGVEVRPIEEVIELFRLEDVNPSPAFFDRKKLDHLNGEWIRRLDVDDFVARASEHLPDGDGPRAALRALAAVVQERVRTLAEVDGYVEFLYRDDIDVDEGAWAKATKDPRSVAMLDETIARLVELTTWEADAVEAAVTAAAIAAGFVNAEGGPQLSKAQASVRAATTGRAVGPPLWQSLAALGRDRTLERLRAGRAQLQ